MSTKQKIEQWQGCYEGSNGLGWKSLITDESFSHPAKFAYGLITRILGEMLKDLHLRCGDVVLDPFGGVATGGILCAYKQISWIGCELEPKFVKLGNDNIQLHRHRLESLEFPVPILLQGDSRKLASIVKEKCNAVISSPPFSPTPRDHPTGRGQKVRKDYKTHKKEKAPETDYGGADGNLLSMPMANLDAVISSPPFAHAQNVLSKREGVAGEYRKKFLAERAKKYGEKHSSDKLHTGKLHIVNQPGQLANLSADNIDALISSPPYDGGGVTSGDGTAKETAEHSRKNVTKRPLGRSSRASGYGVTQGQLGSSPTFWEAARDILLQCHQLLKPGAIAVWVCKDYVQGGKRVPFSDNWLKLCEACGFNLHHRVQAMVVKSIPNSDLFGDADIVKSRKSFFRRVQEKRGAPPIDFEDVIFTQRV